VVSIPVRELLATLCSLSGVTQGALASRIGFRRGLGLEMAGRVWSGTESGSVNDLDETSCELPADGEMLIDLVRRCKSDSSNFG
jgi:hypothetical protein